MSVNIEKNHKGEITKYRPCFDSSRCLNDLMRKNSLQLDTLDRIEPSLFPNCYQCSFDFVNMYFTFRVKETHQKYLGFSIIQHGKTRYFKFTVMVYGLRDAAYIVTRFFRPLKAFFHKIGIIFFIYIDDGKIIAYSYELCDIQTQLVLLFCQLVGFQINYKKSSLTPSFTNLYQGFICDSKRMMYFASDEKQTRYLFNINALVQRQTNENKVPSLQVAAVLGQINSLYKSHGSIVRTMVRNLNYDMCRIVILHGWQSSCILDKGLIELEYFLRYLPEFNGCFIPITRNSKSTCFKKCLYLIDQY